MNEQQLFEHVKENMLKNMPAGMLVTKNDITFDIGYWQHRAYRDNNNIDLTLRNDECSTIINLMIMDETITEPQMYKFLDEIDLTLRILIRVNLVYFLAIPTNRVTQGIKNKLRYKSLNVNRFSESVEIEQYTIFENEFIHNLRYT